MRLISYFRKKRLDSVINEVNKKNIGKRYLMLFVGTLIVAFAFNLFFLKYNLACFGVSGISIVLSEFGVNPSVFILVSNLLLLVLAYFTLGLQQTKNQIIGAILYPILIWATSYITSYINLEGTEMIVIVLAGGVCAGVGYGLIYKSNFSTGGTDVIVGIIHKYLKLSLGTSGLIVNGIVILMGKLVFGWDTLLYAILVSYLISILTDKVLLGISTSKAFYIVTSKEKEAKVRDFLVALPDVGTTVIEAFGGYSSNKEALLLAVVPTRSYYIVKEGLKEIDNNIFFLVCDSYEVSGKEEF